jgi:hypothetical protein
MFDFEAEKKRDWSSPGFFCFFLALFWTDSFSLVVHNQLTRTIAKTILGCMTSYVCCLLLQCPFLRLRILEDEAGDG